MNGVIQLLREIVTKALDKKHLSPEQPCKVELVEEKKAVWKAVRLTTRGCAGTTFRSIGKQRVSAIDDSATLRT